MEWIGLGVRFPNWFSYVHIWRNRTFVHCREGDNKLPGLVTNKVLPALLIDISHIPRGSLTTSSWSFNLSGTYCQKQTALPQGKETACFLTLASLPLETQMWQITEQGMSWWRRQDSVWWANSHWTSCTLLAGGDISHSWLMQGSRVTWSWQAPFLPKTSPPSLAQKQFLQGSVRDIFYLILAPNKVIKVKK